MTSSACLLCRVTALFLLVSGYLLLKPKSDSEAQPMLQFTPPSQITLAMNVLTANGSIDAAIPDPKCYSVAANRVKYGCTYFDGDIGLSPVRSYPFQSDTLSISIENQLVQNVQQGYLHNVVPQELDPGHAASSVRAQAIASRTYAYYQINIYGTLNNSNQFQVYIPYRYDALSAAHKAVIDQAIAGQPYMSLPGSTEPIAAFFSDDTGVWITKTRSRRRTRSTEGTKEVRFAMNPFVLFVLRSLRVPSSLRDPSALCSSSTSRLRDPNTSCPSLTLRPPPVLPLDNAMRLLEERHPKLAGVLPRIYAASNLEPDQVAGLINLFFVTGIPVCLSFLSKNRRGSHGYRCPRCGQVMRWVEALPPLRGHPPELGLEGSAGLRSDPGGVKTPQHLWLRLA